MNEFVATVRLPNGLMQRVTIQADDSGKTASVPEAQRSMEEFHQQGGDDDHRRAADAGGDLREGHQHHAVGG
jgi:hypothetical protein